MKGIGKNFARIAAHAALIASFAGGTALAQQTQQSMPDGGDSGSQAYRHPTIAAVRLPEVLSDSEGIDFVPYFHASVLPPLRKNWHSLVKQKGIALPSTRKVVAEFTILKDGTVDNLKLAESSGDAELDQTALDAITSSAPFAVLPAEFKGQSLSLRCRLDFGPAGPMLLPNGATVPRIISPHAEPEYSDEARRKRIEGVVGLELVVSAEGLPTDIKVTRPLGSGLDEKAIKTVKQWRFYPAMKDGNPVSGKINVQVDFHLYK